MNIRHILFISYDGMTDPLGQSQVLPYLAGLSQAGYSFTLLSCEKPDRFEKHKDLIETIVNLHNIDWQPISFTTSPPILAKYYDLYRLKKKAEVLQREKHFELVHCRSYVSAAIGLALKVKYGVKFLFDMRGFWVDERVDGGAWNLQNPVFKFAYQSYKNKEAAYIANADAIISLTEAGKAEIKTWNSYQEAPIQVIPCSTDFELFDLVTPQARNTARKFFQIPEKALVISYLGSVGMWYMLDEMLEFFAALRKNYPDALLQFITPEPPAMILEAGRKYSLPENAFIIRSATRKQVPEFIAASDINIFFIKQSYSKIASSPTKLGEILAMGIPVICNSKVGDVEGIVKETESGIVIEKFDQEAYKKIITEIPFLLKKDPARIREKALDIYLLENAIEKYKKTYQELIG